MAAASRASAVGAAHNDDASTERVSGGALLEGARALMSFHRASSGSPSGQDDAGGAGGSGWGRVSPTGSQEAAATRRSGSGAGSWLGRGVAHDNAPYGTDETRSSELSSLTSRCSRGGDGDSTAAAGASGRRSFASCLPTLDTRRSSAGVGTDLLGATPSPATLKIIEINARLAS